MLSYRKPYLNEIISYYLIIALKKTTGFNLRNKAN